MRRKRDMLERLQARENMAKSDDTLKRERERKARQAEQLRANLARRKAQKRQQTASGALPEAGLAPVKPDR